MNKVCGHCKEKKQEFEFGKDKSSSDGLKCFCKSCIKQYYINNKSKISVAQKLYREKNKNKIADKKKQWCEKNKDRVLEHAKQYYADNKNEILVQKKHYYEENKTEIIYKKKNYQSKRLKTDINFKITCGLRSRLHIALKNNYKSGSAVRDLGCTIPELKLHLESNFQSGMTWENYGEWHIDHILPLSKFDLTDKTQLLKACHYTNLQPLWAKDNLKKSNKI